MLDAPASRTAAVAAILSTWGSLPDLGPYRLGPAREANSTPARPFHSMNAT